MKQIYIAIYLLYLVLPLHAAQMQQPVELDALIETLTDLPTKDRIASTSKHLDSLLNVGTPLPAVKKRIDDIQVHIRKWDDREAAAYLRFYDRIKPALLPIPSEEVVAIFNSAIAHYNKLGDIRYAGISHYFVGQHLYEQKQYGEAFYHHAKALEFFNKVGLENILDIGKYLHVMALNHYYFRDYERVIKLMQASISLPPYSENLDLQRYNTLGLAYQRLNQLDSAAFYFKRTEEVAHSWNDTTWINLAAGNLGGVYVTQGRYREALPLLMQDYRHNRRQNHHATLARNAAIDIAAVWQKIGRRDSVLHYLHESERLHAVVTGGEPMWKRQRDEEYYLKYYRVFHGYYHNLGNLDVAYRYLDSLSSLSNETDLRYNKMTAKVVEDRLKIQQYLADMAIQEADKQRIRTRLQLIIGVTGLLLLIMALLYYLLRLRRTKELLLAEKDKAIQQAMQEKTEAQLTKANLELQEYMQRLQEKNNMVEVFQQQINKLRNQSAQQSPQLDELTNRLAETKLLTQDDWNDFRQRFNKAFGGELDQLKLKYRNLTSAEERIYALEKMNISTSQMAWMLGISPESVRKARYRLRKKMGTTAA